MTTDDADRQVLSAQDVESEGLDDWRVLFAELHARFVTDDFASALALVDEIGAAAEAADHHPDLELSWGRVGVRLTSHDSGGLTRRDVRLAREVSGVAARLGARAEPAALAVLELALDTPDAAQVRPFWAAVLGHDAGGSSQEIVDPTGAFPSVWFQHSEPGPGPAPAQRWHLDVRVPPEQAGPRIRAALEAGGRLVSDERAPAFVVLADAQGNQACITTWQGRD